MGAAVKQDSIFIRMDSEDKKQVESICKDMGITAATAAKMFFKQLVKERAFPFTPKAQQLPWALQSHTDDEIYQALLESEENINNNDVYSEKEFRKMVKEI